MALLPLGLLNFSAPNSRAPEKTALGVSEKITRVPYATRRSDTSDFGSVHLRPW
jgi:hypothetical protein